MSAPIADAAQALRFILAGNAHVTFVSKKTGERFTFHVEQAEDRIGRGNPLDSPHFVSVLSGPSNDADYRYLGTIFQGRAYSHGRKSKISPDAPSAKAFPWVLARLLAGRIPETVDVYHEGRCGRCGRRLTVPESIETGLGPECAKRAG